MPIRYGIIGCGMMGHEHVENIRLVDDATVSAIFDTSAEMRKIAAQKVPEAQIFDDLNAFLTSELLDCILIVSPNYLHMDQLEAIAAAVTVPILCEKPLYTDPDDLARLNAFAQSYGAPVWVAMEYRYMPPVAAFVDQVQDATGGLKMLTIREHRFPFLPKIGDWNRFNAKSGGTLVEKCCHFFDLMRLIIGANPVRVMASGGQEVNHLEEVYDGATSDIWDCAYVIVDFENGVRAMLELSMFAEGAEYQEYISAVGGQGKLECFVPGPGRFWPEKLGPAPVPKLVESPRFPKGPKTHDVPVDPALLAAGDHNGSTFYQHQKFVEVVRGNGAVEVSLSDGAWAVAMGLAAQESARTGEAVAVKGPAF